VYTAHIETRVLHIGCVADEAYAPGLAVTIRSAAEHLSPGAELRVWLMNCGVTMRTRRKLEQSWAGLPVSVQWLQPDFGAIANFPGSTIVSSLSYLKLFFPQMVEVDRLLYLDTDVLIRSDISVLWQIDLHGQAFGAVQDFGCMTVSDPRYGLPNVTELGLDLAQPYCNCGVLLIDVAMWNRHSLTKRICDYISTRKQMLYVEQEAINAIASRDWFSLEPVWNSLWQSLEHLHTEGVDSETLSRFQAAPKLVHFTGKNKPWLPGCTHPFFAEYRTVSLRTRFPIVQK
jgi:lipopolysaccharide biosynthesis glycosyltransferase